MSLSSITLNIILLMLGIGSGCAAAWLYLKPSSNRAVAKASTLAEERHRQAEARFDAVFQASPIPVVITSHEEGRILDANDAYLSLMGYSREEAIGSTAEKLNLLVDFPTSARTRFVEKNRQQGFYGPVDVRFRCKSGQIVTTMASSRIIELAGAYC